MPLIGRLAIVLLVAWASVACQPAASSATVCRPRLATQPLWVVSAGGSATRFTVEIAATDAERATGLAGRDDIPDGCGMLFRYAVATRHPFWMRGVRQALDVAFIAPDGRIAEIVTLQPCIASCPRHTPAADYTSVLEVRGGLLAALGIAAGDRVER